MNSFSSHMQQPELKIIQAKDVSESQMRIQADVVIVGSGAGGSVMAYELAKAGKRVVVLEAGRYIPSAQFTERMGDAMSSLYQDHGVQPNSLGDVAVLQGACVGGSSVVNACIAFRTPEHILNEWQTLHGLNHLNGKNLQPYFEKIERNLNIHQNEPHEINECAKRIIAGCESMGVGWQPVARNVKQCALTGHCLSGCASDRKQSMLVTYLPWASSYGATIYSDCHAYQILEQDCRATGVLADMRDPESGRRVAQLRVDAQVVVLAAGAIQTPILMTRSEIAWGNRWVGKNLSMHPYVSLLGQFSEPVYGWQGALTGMYVDEYVHPDQGGYLFESGLSGPEQLLAQSGQSMGQDHFQFMLDYKYYSAMNVFIRDQGRGSVSWQRNAVNRKKRIDWELSREDFNHFKNALKKAGRIYFAAGAKKVILPTFKPLHVNRVEDLDDMVESVHFGLRGLYTFRVASVNPQGTARMGVDEKQSVVNGYGECHSVKGLFVADASLFPSCLTVNPQVTVYALSNMVADYIVANSADYFTHKPTFRN